MHFTKKLMEWLRLIWDHFAALLAVEPEDLDLTPFNRRGRLGKFCEVFREQYETILQKMNVKLVV